MLFVRTICLVTGYSRFLICNSVLNPKRLKTSDHTCIASEIKKNPINSQYSVLRVHYNTNMIVNIAVLDDWLSLIDSGESRINGLCLSACSVCICYFWANMKSTMLSTAKMNISLYIRNSRKGTPSGSRKCPQLELAALYGNV